MKLLKLLFLLLPLLSFAQAKDNPLLWGEKGFFSGYSPDDEILNKRTLKTKVFSKNAYNKDVFIGDWHYEDVNGHLQDINTSIVASADTNFIFENVKNTFKTKISGLEGNGIQLEFKKSQLAFNLSSGLTIGSDTTIYVDTIIPRTQANIVLYNNVFPSIDYEYSIGANHLFHQTKIWNNHLFREKTGYAKFSEKVILPEGSLLKDKTGKVINSNTNIESTLYIENEGEVLFSFVQPRVWDDDFEGQPLEEYQDDKKHFKLVKAEIEFLSNDTIIYSVLIPLDWLNSPERDYPVYFDPTVNIGSGTHEPLYQYPWKTYRQQQTAQHLIRSNFINLAGNVQTISFLQTSNNDLLNQNATIKLQSTTNTTHTSFIQGGWSTVYNDSAGLDLTTAPVGGWVDIDVSAAAFNYDGTSNLLLETSFLNTTAGTGGSFYSGFMPYIASMRGSCNCTTPYTFPNANYGTQIPYFKITIEDSIPSTLSCNNSYVNLIESINTTSSVVLGEDNLVTDESKFIQWRAVLQQNINPGVIGLYNGTEEIHKMVIAGNAGDTICICPPSSQTISSGSLSGVNYPFSLRFVNNTTDLMALTNTSTIICQEEVTFFTKQVTIDNLPQFQYAHGDTLPFVVNKNIQEPVECYIVNTATGVETLVNNALNFDLTAYTDSLGHCSFDWIVPVGQADGAYTLKVVGTVTNTLQEYGASFIIGECLDPISPVLGQETMLASEYLCFLGLIDPIQTYNSIVNDNINLGEAAKLAFEAVYYLKPTASAVLPTDSFPIPVQNLQQSNTSNSDFFREARALMYLAYDSYEPAMPRNWFNFPNTDNIPRGLALRILMETFDVAIPSTASTTPVYSDVPSNHPYFKWINYAAEIGISQTLGTFNPQADITNEEFYVFLFRIMTNYNVSTYIPYPDPQRKDYYTPGNYSPEAMAYHLGSNDGIFNYSGDQPFNIPGNGLPLTFSFSYSSAETDLPKELFKDPTASAQYNFQNMGKGWTHNYNARIIKSNGVNASDDRLLLVWPGNVVQVYNESTNEFETPSVYHTIQNIGSNQIQVTTKSQIRYLFQEVTGLDYYELISIKNRFNNELQLSYQVYGSNNVRRLYKIEDMRAVSSRYLQLNYLDASNPDLITTVTEHGMGSFSRNITFQYNPFNKQLINYADIESHAFNYDYIGDASQWEGLLSIIRLPEFNTLNVEYNKNKLSKFYKGRNFGIYRWIPHYADDDPDEYTSCETETAVGFTSNAIKDIHGRTRNFNSPTSIMNVVSFDNGNNIMLPTEWTHNGITYESSYDSNGNSTLSKQSSGSLSIQTTTLYNALNDVQIFTDPRGNVYSYFYDSNDALERLVLPGSFGEYKITQRNPTTGQVIKTKSPEGIEIKVTYNTNGYVTKVENLQLPPNLATHYVPDAIGRIVQTTDANGKSSYIDYMDIGLPESFTDILGNETNYGYNDNYTLAGIQNAKFENTNFTYTPDEDWASSGSFGNSNWSMTYTPNGLPKDVTKRGITKGYSFDNTTLLLTQGMANTYTYTTDGRFNLKTATNTESNITITNTYDALNRISDVHCSEGNSKVSYDYDNASNIVKMYYGGRTSPTRIVEYKWDELNRCVKVWDDDTNEYDPLVTYTYDNDNRLIDETFKNGTYTVHQYDPGGRKVGIVNKLANGQIICSNTFVLDNVGMHTLETFMIPSTDVATPLVTYSTTQYGPSPNNVQQSYAQNGTTYNMQTDASGNVTHIGNKEFTWNFKDMLIAVEDNGTDIAMYKYDVSGLRRYKKLFTDANVDEVTYNLDYSGLGNVIEERIKLNNGSYRDIDYIHSPNGLVCRKFGIATEFYHYDYRGSTLATTDQNAAITHSIRYEHDGTITQLLGQTYDNQYPFTYTYVGKYGVQKDIDDIYYMRARYMHTPTGRFLSEDPVWNENLYAYSGNNSINYIDPSGEFIGTLTGAVIGGAIAAFTGESILKGAVSGAVAGAVFDLTVATMGTGTVAVFAIAGAASGFSGNLVDQSWDIASGDQEGINLGELAISTGVGGALGGAGKAIGNKITNTLGNKATKTLVAVSPNNNTKLLGQPIIGTGHAFERHTINSIDDWVLRSKFTNASEVQTLINNATHQLRTLQVNGNYQRIVNAGRNIGIDKNTGLQTSIYTVITKPNGVCVTAFPGMP